MTTTKKHKRIENFWVTVVAITSIIGILAAITNMLAGYAVSSAAMWIGVAFVAAAAALGYTLGQEDQRVADNRDDA